MNIKPTYISSPGYGKRNHSLAYKVVMTIVVFGIIAAVIIGGVWAN